MSDPWNRQPNESPLWYSRLNIFRLLGPERTIEEVWRKTARGCIGKRRPSRRWYRQAQQWHWQERAAAWDVQEAKAAEELWRKRRLQVIEDEWEMSGALQEKAKEMFAYSLDASKWTFADAGRLADIASRLARLATGMAVTKEQREISGPDGKPIKIDGDILSEEELQRRVRAILTGVGKEG